MAPACVAACPESAIAIEIVSTAEWRKNYLDANAPGLPSAADSISTTRITVPEGLLPDTGRVDTQRILPEQPHWPLVFMLVLRQLSAGAFSVLWLLDRFGAGERLSISAFVSPALAGVSLGASTLHLARPVYAWRALRGFRQMDRSRPVAGGEQEDLCQVFSAEARGARLQLKSIERPRRASFWVDVPKGYPLRTVASYVELCETHRLIGEYPAKILLLASCYQQRPIAPVWHIADSGIDDTVAASKGAVMRVAPPATSWRNPSPA